MKKEKTHVWERVGDVEGVFFDAGTDAQDRVPILIRRVTAAGTHIVLTGYLETTTTLPATEPRKPQCRGLIPPGLAAAYSDTRKIYPR